MQSLQTSFFHGRSFDSCFSSLSGSGYASEKDVPFRMVDLSCKKFRKHGDGFLAPRISSPEKRWFAAESFCNLGL